MTFQLSFDSPQPVALSETAPSDPLIQAIALFEDARAKVEQFTQPYADADREFMYVKQRRDKLKSELAAVQNEMDSVARDRHFLCKDRDAAIELQEQIREAVKSMGGEWTGNKFVTPNQKARFDSGEWRNDPTWDTRP